jgi:type II secretory pathway pseudopilin PulG
MVIVIIGLLAAVVIPKYGDIRSEAQNAAEQGTVAAVRTGIKLVHMTSLAQGSDTYPATLDSASAGVGSETNKLFTNVIEGGVPDANWEKIDGTTYEYVPTSNEYEYDNSDGTFVKS